MVSVPTKVLRDVNLKQVLRKKIQPISVRNFLHQAVSGFAGVIPMAGLGEVAQCHHVAELARLGGEVVLIVWVKAGGQRHPLGNGHARLGQGIDLARVVGHQSQAVDAHMLEHRYAEVVAAHVGSETKALVSFYGVGALVLQMVGANFVEQTDTAPFLAQVEQNAATLFGDALEGFLQLIAAVAAHGKQRIAGQAL